MIKKIIIFLIMSVVFSNLVLINAEAKKDPVELNVTVWTGSEAHLKILNAIGDKFTALHPNVKVKYVTVPFGDYVQKITLQLAGNNPPDAGWMLETSATLFVKSGSFNDITQYVKKYNYDDFSKTSVKLWENAGKVYGVPFSTSPFLVFYNKMD